MVNPVTTSGLPEPVAVFPSGDEVTVYDKIAEPPSDDGTAKLTLACPFPAVAATDVGGPGTVRGVTAAEGADAGPVPTAFDAVTVKV